MDAMFDRMDALGKAVLGLTIAVRPVPQPQVRPDHAGGVLPALRVPEQRPRGPAGRLHAGGAAEDRRHPPGDRRDRGRAAAHDPRLGRSGWRSGRTSLPAQPTWEVVRLANQGDNSQRYIEQKDGSILARGTPRPSSRPHMQGDAGPQDDHRLPAGAAQRPEPAVQRPGPVVHGHVCPERVQRRGLGREGPEDEGDGQVRPGDGRLRQPGARPGAELRRQVEEEAGDRPGRVRHRRQGRHRLGHRRRARPPERAAERGLRAREADRLPERRRSSTST